jgi:hypothetical protein
MYNLFCLKISFFFLTFKKLKKKKMNNEFLQEGLNRTIKELFVFLKQRVQNEKFQTYASLIDLSNNVDYYIQKYISKGIQTDLSGLFKKKEYYNELKLKIEMKDTSLFETKDIEFFQSVNIREWYEELNEQDQTILWKYFKNLFRITTLLSKSTNSKPIPIPPNTNKL